MREIDWTHPTTRQGADVLWAARTRIACVLALACTLLTAPWGLAAHAQTGGSTAQLSLSVTDPECARGAAQGDATLAGAAFEVTDAAGTVVARATTDERGQAGVTGLAPGTYTIRCATAPVGYWGDASWEATVVVDASGAATLTQGTPQMELEAKRSCLLLAKVDADTHAAVPQGDATLAGCVLAVRNQSAAEVVVDGRRFAPGAVCCEVSLGADGEGTSTELPWGTYEVSEARAPQGYQLDTSWSQVVQVRRGGACLDLTGKGISRPKGTFTVAGAHALADPVTLGGVRVAKADATGGMGTARGGATLAGAVFEIASASANAIVVDGVERQPGEVVCTIVTDEAGIAHTGETALPFGTYVVREKTAPQGYVPNASWSRTFSVREQARIVDVTDSPCTDEVVRGDLTLTKVDDETGAPMAGVAFLVRSRTTGEGHVLVTDEAGRLQSASAAHPHTARTNANDAALRADGTVEDGALDLSAGVWFSGRAGEATDASDQRGALPYDTYDVVELASSANAGRRLETRTVRITEEGEVADAGTIRNASTERVVTHLALAGTGTSEPALSPASDGLVHLTDDVSLEHLIVGETYTLTGTLHVRDEANADAGPLLVAGVPVSSTTTFSAHAATERVEVTFAFDGRGLDGTTLVCFEELTGAEGEVVAVHADIEDEDQTVRLAGIATELVAPDGSHEALAAEALTLTDTVWLGGLERDASYELETTLQDQETGVALTGSDGRPIRSVQTLVATSPSAEVTAAVTLDARDLAGTGIVCFERLYRDGTLICEHADLADAAQTVTLPALSTRATSAGLHVVEATASVSVTDTVSFERLTPGTSYVLTGTLYDRTADVAIDSSTTTLVPEAASGVSEVGFTVDLTGRAGHVLVCFEELTRVSDDVLVAVHTDPADPAQTIRVCAIETELTDDETAAHVALAQGARTLTDRVRYLDLTPGDTYRLEGTLKDVATGEAIIGADGEAVSSITTFVAERAEGTAEVHLTLDARDLAGKSVVACERLYSEGQVIARHEDLFDAAQTLRFPALATSLSVPDGSREVSAPSGPVTLTDTVTYDNLEPGLAYELEGTLVDATTGKTAQVAGSPLVAHAELTPELPSGAATVSFKIADAASLAGATLVCCERLTLTGTLVAEHADLTDAAQTVTFAPAAAVVLDTVLHVTGSASHEVPCTSTVRLTDTVTYQGLSAGETYELQALIMDGETGGELRVPAPRPVETTTPATSTDATLTDATTVWVEPAGTYHTDLACDHIEDLTGLARTTLGAARAAGKTPCAFEGTATSPTTSTTSAPTSNSTDAGTLVRASFTFTPEEGSGTVEVPLTLDATSLAGRRLVCFETLTCQGEEVARHADIKDADQTVTVARTEAALSSSAPSSAGTLPTSTTSTTRTTQSPTATAQRSTPVATGTLAQTGRGPWAHLVLALGCVLLGSAAHLCWRRRRSGGKHE